MGRTKNKSLPELNKEEQLLLRFTDRIFMADFDKELGEVGVLQYFGVWEWETDDE